MTLRGPRRDHEPPQPAGLGLQNRFGVYLEQIGVTLATNPAHHYRRAWRGGRLLGRVVDHTNYSRDGTTSALEFKFEAQIWDGHEYEQDGPVYRSFWDALEFLT